MVRKLPTYEGLIDQAIVENLDLFEQEIAADAMLESGANNRDTVPAARPAGISAGGKREESG